MANMNAEAVQFEIERLQECCAQYRDDIELMREAMQEFVDRCDAGKVLSKYTYAKFKRILDAYQPELPLDRQSPQ